MGHYLLHIQYSELVVGEEAGEGGEEEAAEPEEGAEGTQLKNQILFLFGSGFVFGKLVGFGHSVCLRSLYTFYIVTYYIKRVKNSWRYSTNNKSKYLVFINESICIIYHRIL